MFIVTGVLLSYVIGPYVDYVTLAIISIVPVVGFVVSFFFMPESPSYLIGKSKWFSFYYCQLKFTLFLNSILDR